ncbi:MAG TPA: PAS domain-containing protein [Chitinophagaceae bacterium]|nr:PAS domain-containing protein [Chitinophagaceae bacterium]
MPNSTIKQQTFSFLSGGGEMGRLMRNKNWSESTVGTPDTWPQSLRTTLGIILNSKFPMFLWWGPELICFYNDAYRPSLGQNGKHPSILGMPAKEAWPEIWDIIKPLIDQVLSGGDATWMEDQLIPIFRNGKIEDVYWTFSYSPVNDESGDVSGVLVTCTETTENVLTRHKLEESKNQLEFAIEAARLGTWDYNPANNKFFSNDRLREWFGLPHKAEIELEHAINAIAEKDRQRVTDAIQNALDYSSGGHYEIEYTIIHPVTKTETIVRSKGKAWFNEDKIAYRFNGTLEDVTDAVISRKKVEESEQRFRNLIAQSPIPMVVFRGPEHVIEIVNSAMLKRWNKKEEDLLNKRFIEVFPEIKTQRIPGLLDKVYKTSVAYKEEESISFIQDKESKRTIYVDFEYSPLLKADGEVSGIIAIVNDVTEKVEARMKIEESEQKFRLLADSMPQHIWTADTEGNLNYFNRSVFDYSGITPEDINEKGWLQIVHPDDKEENLKVWMNAVSTGKDFLFEHRFRKHDGEYRWQLSRAVPQRDEHGKIQMWVGTSTDIDEMKKHEQLKDDFIKIASHELKTPVTTIRGYVQLLMQMNKNGNDQMLISSLATIDKHVSKLTKLISDLLDVTKIETGIFHLSKENFNINELISELSGDIQSTNSSHKIIFTPGIETSLFADKDRISQVLINLLVNAIKYSPKADKVIISTQLQTDHIIVSVQDFGIGIDTDDHKKVFERFYRVQGKNEKTFPGFGIGLFIAKEIISNHNGKIWVESEKDKGSVFYFSLPVNTK